MILLNPAVGSLRTRGTTPTPLRVRGRDFASLASDLLPPCDFACLLLAAYLSTLAYSLLFPLAPLDAGVWISRGNVALIGAVLAPFVLYDQHFATAASRGQTGRLIRSYAYRCILISAIAIAVATTSEVLDNLPRRWVVIWLAMSLVLTALARVAVGTNVRALQLRGALSESIAVVGSGPAAERLLQRLRGANRGSVELLGHFDDGAASVTGTIAELMELGRTRTIDWILVTQPDSDADDDARLQAVVQRLRFLGVPIALCPHIGLPLVCRRVDYASDGMPVLLLADRPIQRWDAVIKFVEDVVLGSILTLLLLPVFAIVALLIRLDSPGPIIFKQRRHAFNNTEFSIYKFRTMRWTPPDGSGVLQQTRRNDERITPIGRFLRSSSLDELPQLFNVLRGEMSLVGPRPHAVNMRTEDRLGHEITEQYAHRHRVKPGMTGWSQVNGARGATDTTAQLQRRVELDLWYIDHWSFALDLKILVLTVREVLKKTNAY